MDKMSMDKMNKAKRHMGMVMPKEMIMPAAEDAGMTEKQDMSANMRNGAANDEYKSYE